MHKPPTSGNLHDECRTAPKPAHVKDYGRHMGYDDKEERMATRYSISQRKQKLSFQLFDLTVLYS